MTDASPCPMFLLADPGSFCAVDTEGTIGWAKVDDVPVLIFSTDFSVYGGSTGMVRAAAWLTALQQAEMRHTPLIGFYHGGGARLQEGGAAVAAYAQVLAHLSDTRCFSLAVLTGPCAGGDALAPQLADLCFTADRGGVRLSRAGVQPVGAGHFASVDAAVVAVRRAIGFLQARDAVTDHGGDLFDAGTEMALPDGQPRISLVRIAGLTCGVITLQNVLNGDGLMAAARLIRLCDKNGWPVISQVCGTGFDPEADQAALARGAQDVMVALRTARCRKIALITSPVFGASYALFGCKPFFDTVLAFPAARVAAVTAVAAARLTKAADPAAFIRSYTQEFLNGEYASMHHLVDAVMEPGEMRKSLITLLMTCARS